jgi:hypothetical protein
MKYQWYVNEDATKVFMNGVLLNDTQGKKQNLPFLNQELSTVPFKRIEHYKNGLKILHEKFTAPDNQVRMHDIAIDMSFFNGGRFYLDFDKTQSSHNSFGLSYQGDCQKP